LCHDPDAERAHILKYFAAQWITHITTLWDDTYRLNLAELHGCEKNDVASELVRRLEQDASGLRAQPGLGNSKAGKE
jgi:hypothetical protein